MTNRLDHILIVDDDPEICHLLRDYLEKNGFRATAVSNGKALWRTLDDKQIDLVVLDLMLPGEDGLELCRNLRARFDIPILIFSALGEDSPAGVVVPLSAGEFRLLQVFLEHPKRVLTRDQLLELTQGREALPFDRSIDVLVGRLRRPSSLFGRLVLVLLIGLLLAQLLSAIILFKDRYLLLSKTQEQCLAQRMAEIAQVLESFAPKEREKIVAILNTRRLQVILSKATLPPSAYKIKLTYLFSLLF